MGTQVGKRSGRQAGEQVWEAIGYTCMFCPCCCFLFFTVLFCSSFSFAFRSFNPFLSFLSFLCFQTDIAWPCRHSGQLLRKFVKLDARGQGKNATSRADRNSSHLSRLLRSRGSSLLWFGLSTPLRDELLYISSHDAALRPCCCGLADVHICLPGQFLCVGAGNHSATCKSPWHFGLSCGLHCR